MRLSAYLKEEQERLAGKPILQKRQRKKGAYVFQKALLQAPS
jgi:hypothetical protein